MPHYTELSLGFQLKLSLCATELKKTVRERLISIDEKIMYKQNKLVYRGQMNCAFRAR